MAEGDRTSTGAFADGGVSYPVGPVSTISANLRVAPKQIRRQGCDVIDAPGEYRIDDLAHIAGITTRNVWFYRDRGLLPPPLRVGRIALYNDAHLSRLRLIVSMLERNYTLANVDEMLSAWEEGKDLGDVLGLETALVGTWATEKTQDMPKLEAERLIGEPETLARLVAPQPMRTDGAKAAPTPTQLAQAFTTIHDYGTDPDTSINVHEEIVPLIDQISAILVRIGGEHVSTRLTRGKALPGHAEIAELTTMLVRFHTQAVASVTATLAASIEATIESMVGDMLPQFIDAAHAATAPSRVRGTAVAESLSVR